MYEESVIYQVDELNKLYKILIEILNNLEASRAKYNIIFNIESAKMLLAQYDLDEKVKEACEKAITETKKPFNSPIMITDKTARNLGYTERMWKDKNGRY